MTVHHRGAWMPWSADQTWDDAFDAAERYVLKVAAQERVRPLLVTHAMANVTSGPEAVGQFARRYDHITVQSKQGGGRSIPTIVYAGGIEALALAVERAHGSVLVAVDGGSDTGLSGWAMEIGALDLSTGTPTEDTRNDNVRKALDRLEFYSNTGWGDQLGKQTARQLLGDLKAQGLGDPDVISGHMLAHGAHARGIKNLLKLLDKV